MRLLFAIKGLAGASGGAERVFCSITSELAARGHNVIVVTFDRHSERSFYALDARIRCIELAIGDATQPATLGETLRRIGALRRVLRRERPEVAIGFMHSMFVPLAFAATGTATPVVGSEHIVPDHYRDRPLQFFLLMLAAPFLSRMTVLSEDIRKRYPWIVHRRMHVMPNPVAAATAFATESKPADKSAASHVILSVGRLDPQKDHATLIKAFARLANRHPDWRLCIFGEGALRPELEHLIRRLDLTARVELPGVTREIGREYRRAEIFALASRYESFGLATAEAMAHGVTAVGFADCPGTNELIRDNDTGVLVKPSTDRTKALSEALDALISDPIRRRQLGTAAQTAIDARFSLTHVATLWEELLQPLLSSNRIRSTPKTDSGGT